MGPDLANFSNDLRQEIEHSAASGNDVQTTYAGHSSGAVVGESEVYGLDADRVLHIESAGHRAMTIVVAGRSAGQPGRRRPLLDDRAGRRHRPPFVNITASRTTSGHGASPDTFAGAVRLDTCNLPGSDTPIRGLGSHGWQSSMPGSDAWQSMLAVFSGGTAESYRTPEYTTCRSAHSPALQSRFT
ncbi:MAG: hypothetical protein WKF83_15460 [Nocardioidaceae bacterium]